MTNRLTTNLAPLIIGIGNEYRRDDAAGLIVARRLKEQLFEWMPVLEQTGEGATLMETWKEAECVIVIDAVHSGAAPGTIFRFAAHLESLPSKFFHYSTHAFSIAEAIELSRILNQLPPQLIVYGIEGQIFESGTGLSEPVEKTVQEVTQRIKKEIRMHEFSLIADLMHKLDSIARVQHTAKILSVKIKLGALAPISADHLREHFVQSALGTPAAGARLDIEMLTDTTARHAQEIVLDSVEIEE